MSEQLKQFYRDLQEWLETGRPRHKTFDQQYGLCCNAAYYGDNFFNDSSLEEEQADMFAAAGLCTEYPFNDGDHDSYMQESRSGDLFQNPTRLAWIKEHAQ